MKQPILTIVISSILACTNFLSHAQDDTLRVLFLGNSYTAVNDLPTLVADVAAGKGKTLIYDSNTPGGYTLGGHATNTTSLSKIQEGDWDYVVMQEQSQIPVIPYFYENEFLPGGIALADSIRKYNPCAQLVLYLTWGRRFGGMQCDQSGTVCSVDFVDFGHMQDSLTVSYLNLSNLIEAKVAPCGESWRHAIEDTGEVLHSGDNSHPSFSGSYVAACTMYATFWKEASTGTTYIGTLDATMAQTFQQIADAEVLQSGETYHLNAEIPVGEIAATINQNEVTFTHDIDAFGTINWIWNFGDGQTSTEEEPIHVYPFGAYTATLTANQCGVESEFQTTVQITSVNTTEIGFSDLTVRPLDREGHYIISTSHQIESIFCYDLKGQSIPISIEKIAEHETRLTMPSSLPGGVYLLQVRDENFGEGMVKVFR